MQRQVVPQGYPPFMYLLAHFAQAGAGYFGPQSAPVQEIQVRSPLLDILSNQPGNWDNLAVPWPDGFVQVTVAARPLQELK